MFCFSRGGGLLGFLLGFSASRVAVCLLACLLGFMAHGIPRSRHLHFSPPFSSIKLLVICSILPDDIASQNNQGRGIGNQLSSLSIDPLTYHTINHRPLHVSFIDPPFEPENDDDASRALTFATPRQPK